MLVDRVSLLSNVEKGGFPRLSAAHSEEKMRPGTAASCLTNDNDGVKHEKRLIVSHDLDQLLD